MRLSAGTPLLNMQYPAFGPCMQTVRKAHLLRLSAGEISSLINRSFPAMQDVRHVNTFGHTACALNYSFTTAAMATAGVAKSWTSRYCSLLGWARQNHQFSVLT
jgi:hypothetical protein